MPTDWEIRQQQVGWDCLRLCSSISTTTDLMLCVVDVLGVERFRRVLMALFALERPRCAHTQSLKRLQPVWKFVPN
jgi:hypothetical protein